MILDIDSLQIFYIIKILFTIFVVLVIPIYWKNYGPQNFLWLSDIGLFITLFALWFKSSVLMSIAVTSILPVEIVWNIDFFTQLITGYKLFNLADYMFKKKYSNFLKSLSLFHVFMPIIWLIYLIKWGYNPNILGYSIILVWLTLILTYLFTDPKKNINWVFQSELYKWEKISNLDWLIILMLSFTFLALIPLHDLLKSTF